MQVLLLVGTCAERSAAVVGAGSWMVSELIPAKIKFFAVTHTAQHSTQRHRTHTDFDTEAAYSEEQHISAGHRRDAIDTPVHISIRLLHWGIEYHTGIALECRSSSTSLLSAIL